MHFLTSMFSGEQIYQAITFVVVVLLCDTMERMRPGFNVSRNKELSLNILAIIVVIVAGEQVKKLAFAGFNILNLDILLTRTVFRSLPIIPKILMAITLTDFCLYWVHRAMHKPLLWPTHSFHHSIGEIWWLAGSRTSLTHLFLFAIPQIFIGYYLLGFNAMEAGVTFSFGVVVNLWIHTNIRVNIGPLENILITPNFHRIHHGAKGLTRNNLAFVFTIWDRMFGTYASVNSVEKDFSLFPVPTKNRLLRMIIGF